MNLLLFIIYYFMTSISFKKRLILLFNQLVFGILIFLVGRIFKWVKVQGKLNSEYHHDLFKFKKNVLDT